MWPFDWFRRHKLEKRLREADEARRHVSPETVPQREIERKIERINWLHKAGKLPTEQAKKEIEALRQGRIRAVEGVGAVSSTLARGKGPFTAYGRIEGKGWGVSGLRLIDPKVRSAVNKGRIKLRKYAHGLYMERYKEITITTKKIEDEIKGIQKNYDRLLKRAEDLVSGDDQSSIMGMMGKKPSSDSLGAIAGMLGTATGGKEKEGAEANFIIEQIKIMARDHERAVDRLEKLRTRDAVTIENEMKGELTAKAQEIVAEILAELGEKGV